MCDGQSTLESVACHSAADVLDKGSRASSSDDRFYVVAWSTQSNAFWVPSLKLLVQTHLIDLVSSKCVDCTKGDLLARRWCRIRILDRMSAAEGSPLGPQGFPKVL